MGQKKRRPPESALVAAVVREWHDELGWGVLDTPETPGGCWAHFSDVRGAGYRSLTAGQTVWVAVEPAHQDGFEWRATEVQLTGDPATWLPKHPQMPNDGAYRSTLSITLEDGTTYTGEDATAFLESGRSGHEP